MKNSKSDSPHSPICDDHIQELNEIGHVVQELRFNFGLLTQKELAEKSGVHYNTIQAIESGRNYNILSLLKVISAFEYELSTFIKDFL